MSCELCSAALAQLVCVCVTNVPIITTVMEPVNNCHSVSITGLFDRVVYCSTPFLLCPTGLLNRLLSWQGFLVTTRLSYALYLTQIPVLTYFIGKNRAIHSYSTPISSLVSFE
jgi:peptidoglycan/LPS O-acetylase OafA/YrhL